MILIGTGDAHHAISYQRACGTNPEMGTTTLALYTSHRHFGPAGAAVSAR